MAPRGGEKEVAGLGVADTLLAQLLWNRGVRTAAEAKAFLEPSYERDVHSPFLFSHMDEAVAILLRTLRGGGLIVIHGDYDADGVCGASLLYDAITQVARFLSSSSVVQVFLPDRERDGYGVGLHTAEQFVADGARLVITVDCGIASSTAIARLRASNISVIVCDHHALSPELPNAILLHPLVPGEEYPNKRLCGTGVACKLAFALFERARAEGIPVPVGAEKWLLDLVAVATVTDVMPMVGENRALELFGLRVLQKTRRPGLRHLLRLSGTPTNEPLTTTHIGFRIGPRLNAAGRLKSAALSHRVLVEEDDLAAAVQAAELDLCNRERQRQSDALYQTALDQAEAQKDEPLLFVHGEDWHLGLVGLVAGKLQSAFARPVIVAGKHGDRYVGSGRSLYGYNLVEALHVAKEHFVKYGGHPQACGFTIEGDEHFAIVREAVLGHARSAFSHGVPMAELSLDARIPLAHMETSLFDALQKLEPHGEGNPRPVFLVEQARVHGAFAVGRDRKHLRLLLSDETSPTPRSFVAFDRGADLDHLPVGSIIDVACEVSLNTWGGRREVQGTVVDLRRR